MEKSTSIASSSTYSDVHRGIIQPASCHEKGKEENGQLDRLGRTLSSDAQCARSSSSSSSTSGESRGEDVNQQDNSTISTLWRESFSDSAGNLNGSSVPLDAKTTVKAVEDDADGEFASSEPEDKGRKRRRKKNSRSKPSEEKLVTCKLPFSSLSDVEHSWYVKCAPSYHLLSPEDKLCFNSLHERALVEASERVGFFQKLSLQNQSRYYKHSEGCLAVHRKSIADQLRVLKDIPLHYCIHSHIPLGRDQGEVGLLCHERLVCRVGKVPVVHFEQMSKHCSGSTDRLFTGKAERKCASKGMKLANEEGEAVVPNISGDKLAMKLGEINNAGIVLTGKSFEVMVSLASGCLEDSWQIPFRICAQSNSGKATILFDDPLPSVCMPVKEMLGMSSRICLKDKITEECSCGEGRSVYFLPFGKEEESSEKADCEGLAKEIHNKFIDSGLNAFYNTWVFGPTRILLRHSTDFLLSDPQEQTEDHRKSNEKYACLRSKVEYSLYEGYEKFTIPELLHWWISLFSQPSSHLVLARLDPEREKAAGLERMNRASIDAYAGASVRPEEGITNFRLILNHVEKLPCGSYILAHRKGEAQVLCFSAAPEVGEAEEHGKSVKKMSQVLGLHNSTDSQARKLRSIDIYSDGGRQKYTVNEEEWGVLNKEFEFIPPQWRPSSDKVPQIYETFPPWKEKKPGIFFSDGTVMHCISFAQEGKCKFKDGTCRFPHLSSDEVNECRKMFDMGQGRMDPRKILHCFAFLQGQSCPFGGKAACPYPHLDEKCVKQLQQLAQRETEKARRSKARGWKYANSNNH